MTLLRNFWNAIWWLLTLPWRLLQGLGRAIQRLLAPIFRPFAPIFAPDPVDTSLGDAVDKAIQRPGDILVHIAALRFHLLRSVVYFALATGLAFSFANAILDFLAQPLPGGIESLQVIEVTEPISVLFRISLLSGFALALPLILLEVILYIAPALNRSARIALVLLGLPSATALFFGGMAFAFFVMLPAALPFLLSIFAFEASIRASAYINFVTGVLFWLGVVFQMPLVIYVLARLRWVKAAVLAKQWRLAIVLIAVLAAVITPTIDPINMSIVMGPLIVLYFLSVGLAFLAQRGRQSA